MCSAVYCQLVNQYTAQHLWLLASTTRTCKTAHMPLYNTQDLARAYMVIQQSSMSALLC